MTNEDIAVVTSLMRAGRSDDEIEFFTGVDLIELIGLRGSAAAASGRPRQGHYAVGDALQR